MALNPAGGLALVALPAVVIAEAPPPLAPPPTELVEFYTRPLVRARLRLPGSLSDYTVVSVRPVADDPGRYDIEVRFRARTPFGGTTAHGARFRMKRADDASWIVTAADEAR